MSTQEEWRSIPGHPMYEASNLGRVRSIPRDVPHYRGGIRRMPGKLLSPIAHKDGYFRVKLGGPNITRGVHQAVALAFLGAPPDGHVVNHIDGVKTNNTPGNLEYVTSSENVLHAYRTGLLSNKGESNAHAKLTDEKVRQIRAATGTQSQIANAIGCSKRQVSSVRSGESWTHVS